MTQHKQNIWAIPNTTDFLQILSINLSKSYKKRYITLNFGLITT